MTVEEQLYAALREAYARYRRNQAAEEGLRAYYQGRLHQALYTYCLITRLSEQSVMDRLHGDQRGK